MKIHHTVSFREYGLFAEVIIPNQEHTPLQCSPADSHSLNSRVIRATTITAANQMHVPEIQLDPQLENQRKPILELLTQYRLKFENLVRVLQAHCNHDATLCALATSLSNSISINIRMVRIATSIRDLRQILDKLQNMVLDISTRVQNIASPPLLAKLKSLHTDILLKLSVSAFDQAQLLAHKEEITNRIQRFIVNTDEAKGARPGLLSTKFIRRLEWGYETCKNDLLLAKWSVQHAQNNEDINRTLRSLRKSIVQSGQTLRSVLRSPQRNLQERTFSFLGKLYALRRELGETVEVSIPWRTLNIS